MRCRSRRHIQTIKMGGLVRIFQNFLDRFDCSSRGCDGRWFCFLLRIFLIVMNTKGSLDGWSTGCWVKTAFCCWWWGRWSSCSNVTTSRPCCLFSIPQFMSFYVCVKKPWLSRFTTYFLCNFICIVIRGLHLLQHVKNLLHLWSHYYHLSESQNKWNFRLE